MTAPMPSGTGDLDDAPGLVLAAANADQTVGLATILVPDADRKDVAFDLYEAAGILGEYVVPCLVGESKGRMTETVAWLRALAEEVDP